MELEGMPLTEAAIEEALSAGFEAEAMEDYARDFLSRGYTDAHVARDIGGTVRDLDVYRALAEGDREGR